MTEEEKRLREYIGEVAAEYIASGDALGWFEELYAKADGDIDAIPWLDLEPNRFLVEWDRGKLNRDNGQTALVIGCGLGDEAKYLDDRGFNVTAFDISESAINWARRIHRETDIEFLIADLFDPPEPWNGYFDLIVEVYTIQALPLGLRDQTIDAICSFAKGGGDLVVVQRLRADSEQDPDGPPWAVSRAELSQICKNGFAEVEFETFPGDEEEPVDRFVAAYKKQAD